MAVLRQERAERWLVSSGIVRCPSPPGVIQPQAVPLSTCQVLSLPWTTCAWLEPAPRVAPPALRATTCQSCVGSDGIPPWAANHVAVATGVTCPPVVETRENSNPAPWLHRASGPDEPVAGPAPVAPLLPQAATARSAPAAITARTLPADDTRAIAMTCLRSQPRRSHTGPDSVLNRIGQFG